MDFYPLTAETPDQYLHPEEHAGGKCRHTNNKTKLLCRSCEMAKLLVALNCERALGNNLFCFRNDKWNLVEMSSKIVIDIHLIGILSSLYAVSRDRQSRINIGEKGTTVQLNPYDS